MEHKDTKRQRFWGFFYFVPLCLCVFVFYYTIHHHPTPNTHHLSLLASKNPRVFR